MGDGGVVLTADSELAERARTLRDYGQRARYEHVELGLNSRLDEMQAAILRSAFLPRLDQALARRREIAVAYTEALREGPLQPICPRGGTSAYHLFPIEVVDRELAEVTAVFERYGISVGRHYPFVCPDQSATGEIGEVSGSLPSARRLAARELSLPIHPYLRDEEVEVVIEACRCA